MHQIEFCSCDGLSSNLSIQLDQQAMASSKIHQVSGNCYSQRVQKTAPIKCLGLRMALIVRLSQALRMRDQGDLIIQIAGMTNISNLNLTKGSIPPLLKYKIVFLGDQAVGKSSIINRFIYDIFDGNEHRPTIGIDFISQNIFLEEKTIRLQLWDTAGQERFRSLIPNYIRDSSVSVIVYDVTNRASFNSLQKWIDDVKQQRGEGVIIALLANKIDMQQRQVAIQQGEQLAKDNEILFKEVSAKSGVNVQQFFKEIAALLPEATDTTARENVQRRASESQKNENTNVSKPNEPIILSRKNSVKKQSGKDKKQCC